MISFFFLEANQKHSNDQNQSAFLLGFVVSSMLGQIAMK
jgi:hypothetical protein